MLFEALTTRKTVTVGEKLIVPYKLPEVRLQMFSSIKVTCGETLLSPLAFGFYMNTKPESVSVKSFEVVETLVC